MNDKVRINESTKKYVLKCLEDMRRKLLDRTVRNKLLSFPIEGKQGSLRIVDISPNRLYHVFLKEEVMQFAPLPIPTQKQLRENGFSNEGSVHPVDENEWADSLGFDEKYELPLDGGIENGDPSYCKLRKVRELIDQNLKDQDSLIGMHEVGKQLNLSLQELSSLVKSYDYKDIGEFERAAKDGQPLKTCSLQQQKTLEENQIQTPYFSDRLETILRSMYDKSQSSIREAGTSILYFVLGFLEWYEADDYEKPRFAPLFTIPVSLERGKSVSKSGLGQYYLRYTGEPIRPNLSLEERLQDDFGIVFPELTEGMLPEDYFFQVQKVIEKSKSHWTVRRYGMLGLLNFSKMLMCLDLDPARWPEGNDNILNHEIVQRLFIAQSSDKKTVLSDQDTEYKIDEIDSIHQDFPLIDDADSSQHSALIDVINGKNLVIEGPPGTGKSQTITNLIAVAMARGKTVLFCAQKMAAIEVVKQRLEKAGLGDFCLEIHSHKIYKRSVLDDIRKCIDNRIPRGVPQEFDTTIALYEEQKSALNHYAQEINQVWKNTELTIHQILMGSSRYRRELGLDSAQLQIEGISGEAADSLSRSRLGDRVKAFRDAVIDFRKQAGEKVDLSDHPWYGVKNPDIHVFNYNKVISSLNHWQSALIEWQKACDAFLDKYAIRQKNQNFLHWQEQLVGTAENMPVLPKLVHFEAFKKIEDGSRSSVQKWMQDFSCVQDEFSGVAVYLLPARIEDLRNCKDIPLFCNICEEFDMSDDVSFGEIKNVISSLSEMSLLCKKYWEKLSELIQSFPLTFSKGISARRNGFQNIVTLLNLASALPVKLLRYRDDIFDKDGIDIVLGELSERLDSLRILQDSLKDIFDIDKLPNAKVLQSLSKELRSSGLFGSFKNSWKEAKKSLLDLAKHPGISWKRLYAQLPNARQFVVERDSFEKRNFKNLLGENYQGLSTDVVTLQKLRGWYREVRQVWGRGSGPDVVLGDSLLILDSQLFKGLQKLQREGLSEKIVTILNKLSDFEKLLPKQKNLQDFNAVLVGENNIFDSLSQKLSHTFEPWKNLFKGDDLLLKEAKEIGESLQRLQKSKIVLDEESLIGDLFGKDIPLNIFDIQSKESEKSLAIIKGTLEFVDSVKENIHLSELVTVCKNLDSHDSYQVFLKDIKKLESIWAKHIKKKEDFLKITQLDMEKWTLRCGDDLVKLIERNATAVDKPRLLNSWISLMHMVQDMEDKGLKSLQEAVFDAKLDVEKLESALLLAIYHQLAHEIFTEKPHLMHFSGIQLTTKQERFREYDEKLKLLQRQRIASIIDHKDIAQGVSGGRKSDYTELSLIRSELGKKGRNIPIRQLISRAKTSLFQLKPCVMMSPMSVANYLEPGDVMFDLVIMDESSQIKPEDALGVIARGKQIVVVGDPKQLPPTRFFDNDGCDREDSDEVAAVSQTDSILDALLPLFSMCRLRWHYRSQHENLIAYSNHHFYDDNLIVFPSPYADVEKYGIRFTYIENGTVVDQCNPEESLIIARAIKDHAMQYPEESLGVVAMNSKQSDQIENALNKLCRKDNVAEKAIDKLRMHSDPFFIKNLENVQGDERDVIFISFTYGPNEPNGRVFQRFGPINSDVGWRRLNVLFTRARKRINVFSSIRYEDISVDKDTKRGIRVMRDFLRFAETGYMIDSSVNTKKNQHSDFEVSVIGELQKAGFSCDSHIGGMGFSLDIAVQDPSKPGHYLMGIECDGSVYNSAKSARDRDRLRKEVLERMGWSIRRIWSIDWFRNPDEVIEPIIRDLRKMTRKSN
ncbi:DUF4011 domain-containing anti-phage protein Hhe [Candidatus Liberibacter sp.]|uniref:DUF4011 domain-containing anti-phage protein Hhe n=1 Tax=Candidatus Liberibacter sp. TaxID=34022 RepID=UPI0015F73506|nr:DUF4011 domain-containing anti-phage protein Hhe [Candidatus Liberibacter sp.]MBA5724232.1 DUF4011 domain-containing protein [Candidatus Liberibacter sp.]